MLSAFVDNNGFWDQLQNAVSESCGMMLASYLGEGQLTNIGEEEVTIQLANTFHRNQLLERANRQSVEACIEKLLGSPHRLNVIAGSPAKENAPAQPKAESHKPPSPPREQPSVQESIAIGDPNVEEVVRRFQGTVLSARELKPDQTEEI